MNLKDNDDFYLKCDVLLLASVFEKFTQFKKLWTMLSNLSVPALSWDAVLNMIKTEVEIIPDVGTYLFFEKHMRG